MALLLLFTTGCGYALAGRGAFLPDYIKRIGVPEFVNRSTIFDLDRTLTDAVRLELGGRGQYTVVPSADGVDAVITATINSVVLTPVTFNAERQATRMAIIVNASVDFTDLHTSKVIWSNPALQFREEYDVSASSQVNDPNALFNQNANALQRLAQDFARSVVTSILENF